MTQAVGKSQPVGVVQRFPLSVVPSRATQRPLQGRNLGALDRFDARRLIIVTSLGYGFGVGLLAATGSEAAFVASAAIAGLAHGVLFPVMTSQVVARARDSERGSALAAFTALFDVGLVAMAPVVGQLIDLSGYTAGFGFVGVSVLVVTSAYGVWDRRHAIAAVAA